MRGTNLIVFRNDAKQVGRHEFRRNLEAVFWNLRNGDSRSVLDALVLAGQLESSLWDCASPIASRSSAVTDTIAQCLVEGSWSESSCFPSFWDEVLVSFNKSACQNPKDSHITHFTPKTSRMESHRLLSPVRWR